MPCDNYLRLAGALDAVVDLRREYCTRIDDVHCVPEKLETVSTVVGWTCAGTAVASLFSLGIFAPAAAVACGSSAALGVTKGIGCIVNGGSGWDISLAFGGAALDLFGAGEATAAFGWAKNCKTIGRLLREAKAAKAAGQVFKGGKLMSLAVKARNSARAVRSALSAAQRAGHCVVEIGFISECIAEWEAVDTHDEL